MVGETTLLIATTNTGKLREVRAILSGLPVRVETLEAHPGLPVAVEDGVTFEDNARIKALHYANLTGRITVADDSGLEVDALGGAPGVYSARFAGDESDTASNNAKLVTELAGVADDDRSARFQCVVAIAEPGSVVATARGHWEGRIVDEPRGDNGFGYDPHFFVPDQNATRPYL